MPITNKNNKAHNDKSYEKTAFNSLPKFNPGRKCLTHYTFEVLIPNISFGGHLIANGFCNILRKEKKFIW